MQMYVLFVQDDFKISYVELLNDSHVIHVTSSVNNPEKSI